MTNWFKTAFAAVIAAVALFTIAPAAHAQNTQCFTYTASPSGYPADGSHAYICGPNVNSTPIQARRDELFRDALIPAFNNKTQVRTKLSQQNVVFYFFRNRDEANNFFANTPPFAGVTQYQTATARCGNTAYHSSAGIVAVAIYDTCTLSTGSTFSDPLARTGLHEAGHGFAFAYQRGGATAPDRTSGFSSLYSSDKTKISPSNWSSYTTAQKNTYICGMFGTASQGQLEIDLGSTTTTGPVCVGTTPQSPFSTHTPSQIAINDKKVAPYFIGGQDYIEMWAEEFTVYILNKISPANFLPITDFFIGYNGGPAVGGVTPPRPMNCTRKVVESYVDTGARPTNAELTAIGCAAQSQL